EEVMGTAGRFRFSTFWASVLIGLGCAFVVVGVAGAGLLMLFPAEIPVPPPWPRPLVAAVILVGGLVVAVPLVLTGQLVQIILDQRRLLGQIHRRLRRFEDERESERTHRMWGPGRHPGGPAGPPARASWPTVTGQWPQPEPGVRSPSWPLHFFRRTTRSRRLPDLPCYAIRHDSARLGVGIFLERLPGLTMA